MNKTCFTFVVSATLIAFFVLLGSPNALAATVVSDTTISLSAHAGAVCNNGEPANMRVTTVADGAGISDKWFVHLQGGGSCKDDTSCQDRWPQGMKPSSYVANGLPNLTRTGGSFDGYNTVQINYCSSDGWIGSKPGSVDAYGDPIVYNGTDTLVIAGGGTGTYAIHFRGKRIVQAALDEIENLYSLTTSATEIVLAGKSAGSAGVQAHIDKVDDQFGAFANVRGLMVDTWVPFLPLAGTENDVRTELSNQGISTATIDELLEFAYFDADDNLLDLYTTANVWGAFNEVGSEGWPGPESCFDAISELPSVIANPSHLMLCAVSDFVLDPDYNDGVEPYITTEMLVLRNFYDIAVGLAAFRLFPDHAGVDETDFANTLYEVLAVQALSELRNYWDTEGRKDVLVDASSELAVALYSVLFPLTQASLESAAGASNISVFAPGLEMSTQNCSFFNPSACSFPESQRRGLPTHGIVDLYLDGSCSAGYAALFGQPLGSVKCTNTFTGHLIQPYNSSALGPARTIKQYLTGWADYNSTYDYSLVRDNKVP